MLRRAGTYPSPRYVDPMDTRLVSLIRHEDRAKGKSVNILGAPYDGGTLGRKGAAEGPSAVRQSLSGFSNYDIETGESLLDAKVVDLGDVVCGDGDITVVHSRLEKEIRGALRNDSMLVTIGGDNSVSLPALRAFGSKFGKIGLVVVDSHLDLRGKIGGKPTSGSSYGLAMETVPGLDPKRVVEVGVHGFLNSGKYHEKAERLGVTLYTAEDVRRKGAARVAREAFSVANDGADAVYFSVDFDAIDLSFVSGVSAPSVGGITANDLVKIARYVARREKALASDIVELAPGLDPTGRSSIVAATCLVGMVAGFMSRR